MTQRSAEVVLGDADTPQARARFPRGLAQTRDWLRLNLFLETAGGPIGWRKATLAVVLVLAGAAISLSRTVGPGR